MTLTQARELAAETGKCWLLAPDWAGATAQPLADWKRFSGETPSVARLKQKGFEIACPPGSSLEDLVSRNELAD